jgi:biopolymer transport protein ExbD
MWAEPHLSKYRRGRLFINVTSLVDVLFILLIFFALSSSFDRLGSIELDLPKAKTSKAASQAPSHEITVTSRGEYKLDGVIFSREGLISAVKGWSALEKKSPVVLKADDKTSYGKVIEVLDVLREHEVKKIQALTKKETGV